jgi:lysozyme
VDNRVVVSSKDKITPIVLSDDGCHFIGNFEGFSSFPYMDGGGLWTIAYGHRINNPSAYEKTGCTRQQAAAWMREDVAEVVQGLTDIGLELPLQHHQDAVISLVYNIGIGAFRNSVICECIRACGVDLYAWEKWCRDNKGVVEPGLVKRRAAELKLFIYGLYS